MVTTKQKTYKVLDSWKDGIGTSLQGYVQCSYSLLVQLFGSPMEGSDKSKAEWVVKTDDDVVFTIYDWKSDVDPIHNTDWHIGGFNDNAMEAIHEIIDQSYEERSQYVARFRKLKFF